MKTELELRREKDEAFARMMKHIEEKGAEGMYSFRFIHLAITYVTLEWVLSNLPGSLSSYPSPIEIDNTMEQLRAEKEQIRSENPQLQQLLDTMRKHLQRKGLDNIEVVGTGDDLRNKVSEILKKREGNNQNVENKAKENFMDIVEKIAESREIKKNRKEKDVKGSEEYKALLKKLGMDK